MWPPKRPDTLLWVAVQDELGERFRATAVPEQGGDLMKRKNTSGSDGVDLNRNFEFHWGGPGALFWMWVTAFLGMATKYTEVTLAQRYRAVIGTDRDAKKWEGTVSGGPMYYIERGLGPKWKWLAILFSIGTLCSAAFTGNMIQANGMADAITGRQAFKP